MASLPPIDVPTGATGTGVRRACAGEPTLRYDYLLRLGDDALVLGQRLANGAGTGRCSRSTSASPTSRST